MRNNSSPISVGFDGSTPNPYHLGLPARLERKIAARWKEWAPWVRLAQLRRSDYDLAAAETARLCERHREHILAFTSTGISMRLVRRHRLDDPRITDEVREMLVQAAMERRAKAGRRRREALENRLNMAALALSSPAQGLILSDCQGSEESLVRTRASGPVTDPQELDRTIEWIRKRVSEQFHLAEMRDADLKRRSNRQVFVLPRQLAMYLVRQLTAASLQEIGRQFGGRHHTTVLHSINKIENLRRLDGRPGLRESCG